MSRCPHSLLRDVDAEPSRGVRPVNACTAQPPVCVLPTPDSRSAALLEEPEPPSAPALAPTEHRLAGGSRSAQLKASLPGPSWLSHGPQPASELLRLMNINAKGPRLMSPFTPPRRDDVFLALGGAEVQKGPSFVPSWVLSTAATPTNPQAAETAKPGAVRPLAFPSSIHGRWSSGFSLGFQRR